MKQLSQRPVVKVTTQSCGAPSIGSSSLRTHDPALNDSDNCISVYSHTCMTWIILHFSTILVNDQWSFLMKCTHYKQILPSSTRFCSSILSIRSRQQLCISAVGNRVFSK